MRQLSQAALQAVLSQDTPEVFIPILKITHPNLATPILLAYNTETMHRADGDYLPYPFEINIPESSDNEAPTVNLTVDNTDLSVNDAIRSLTGMPTVTFSVVLASSPDTVEVGPFALSLQNAQATAQTISGTLGFELGIFSQAAPSQTYIPVSSPGLFL